MKVPKRRPLRHGYKEGWGTPNSNPKLKKKINRAKPDGFKRS